MAKLGSLHVTTVTPWCDSGDFVNYLAIQQYSLTICLATMRQTNKLIEMSQHMALFATVSKML